MEAIGLLADCFRLTPIVNQKMTNAKKILITTRRHELFVVQNVQNHARGLCESCQREVEMLTVDQAVVESRLKTSELVRMTESNELHGIETETGHLLICKNSLSDLFC